MVHPKGFEPLTARFVAEYSIQLSYGCKYKLKNGASEGIRTPDRPVRSRVLYPAELRMHIYKMAVKEGFEPSIELLTLYSLSRGAPSASRPSHRYFKNTFYKRIYKKYVAHILRFIENMSNIFYYNLYRLHI